MSQSPGRRLDQLEHISVGELRGVGEKKRRALHEMEIETVLDLLLHYPRRYADRTHAALIADLEEGIESAVTARVTSVTTRRLKAKRSIVEVVVNDRTGSLRVMFFNQSWRARQLHAGAQVVVFGRPDRYRNKLQMTNPIVDQIGDQTGRVIPIYRQSGKAGISSSDIANFMTEALERSGVFADPLTPTELSELGLLERTAAFQAIHAPSEYGAIERARRRLAFDELWRLQVALVARKTASQRDAKGISHVIVPDEREPDLVRRFISHLPFLITDAQRRAIAEIAADLKSPFPMNRLLQGDVGSGKTVVALAALLYGVQGGYEGALMVPTEVLAEQHYLLASRLLKGLEVIDETRLSGRRPVHVALLTSRTPGTTRQKIIRDLVENSVDILIGTQALLTDEVQFSRLGVVVIDEQHRFGVDQRAALREKNSADRSGGRDPDLLVMTATPIPRTAAMLVYGDLDQSVIDELPSARTPVRTELIEDQEGYAAVLQVVRDEVEKGHQAFVVCPLVKDDDEVAETDEEGLVYSLEVEDGRLFDEEVRNALSPRPAHSAEAEFLRLQTGALRGLRVGLLHGQLPSREKEATMAAFTAGEFDVLVATTVIEVGIDVPSATVVVVLDADRFGIAQLHQLRGRVGRGEAKSVCYLVANDLSIDARRRLEAVVQTNDGFVLAESDLLIRGQGTVLGARQKGRSDLRLASLGKDVDLIGSARLFATRVISQDPELTSRPLVKEELALFVGDEAAGYLTRS